MTRVSLKDEIHLIKHVCCPRELTAAEIWTKCLFSTRLVPGKTSNWLEQPQVKWWQSDFLIKTPCVSSRLPPVCVRVFFSFFLLPNAVYTCLFMLPQDALSTQMEHITVKCKKKKICSLATGNAIAIQKEKWFFFNCCNSKWTIYYKCKDLKC